MFSDSLEEILVKESGLISSCLRLLPALTFYDVLISVTARHQGANTNKAQFLSLGHFNLWPWIACLKILVQDIQPR